MAQWHIYGNDLSTKSGLLNVISPLQLPQEALLILRLSLSQRMRGLKIIINLTLLHVKEIIGTCS